MEQNDTQNNSWQQDGNDDKKSNKNNSKNNDKNDVRNDVKSKNRIQNRNSSQGSNQDSSQGQEQNDLVMRPISGRDELGLFCRLSYALNRELAGDLAAGRRRTDWMWVALRGDRVLARVGWWCRPGDSAPFILDILDLDESVPASARVDTGVRLLRTAMSAVVPDGAHIPEYARFVPPDWRESPAERQAVEERMRVLERTGARLLVERLRLGWSPDTPVPEPGGRLAFRPVAGEAELLDMMTSVLDGTLDAHDRDDLTRMSARDVAVKHYEGELARYTTPREWWRVATLPDGEPVGFVLPSHNGYNPIIAYIAVLPAHRGHGYIDELLAEGTRILAAQDVPRIRASTDLGNTPMANAFQRAGYVNFEREIDMTWT